MAQYLINRKWRRVAERAGIATLLGFCTIVGVGANRSRATVASITGRPIVSQATVDYVSVNASRGLVTQSVAVLTKSFESFGWKTMVVHQGTLDLTRVRRNIIDVQVAPSGSGFPMSSLAVDPYAIAATMGQEVQKTLSSGAIVVGVSSAQLRGAAVGDTMTITGWNGASLDVTVGAIVPDARIGGVEVVLSTTTAASIGFVRPFTIRAWGFVDRASAQSQTASIVAAWTRQRLRARYSWVPRTLEDPVSQVRIKQMLGEFSITRRATGALRIDPAWASKNLSYMQLPIVGRVRCNVKVGRQAAAALQELISAKLGALVHGPDSRRFGGCFSARVTRSISGSSGWNLSRHTWGAAIDINPTENPYGGPSRMDRRVIDAFRHHGFVWGGTFLVPDPMHFEYVGTTS